MKEVNVDKAQLLVTLRENRDRHIITFRGAIQGWRDEAVEQLDGAAKSLMELELSEAESIVEFPSLWVEAANDRPECHRRDYDRAIAMLEMSHDTIVSISAREFDHFVNDEWDWKTDAFSIANTKYISTR